MKKSDIRSFQRGMKERYEALPAEEQAMLRARFLAANPHRKEFNFTVDGVRGSSTKFFETAFTEKKEVEKPTPPEPKASKLKEIGEKLNLSGFAVADVGVYQDKGFYNLSGQISGYYDVTSNIKAVGGVSFRPEIMEDGRFGTSTPFLTAANFTIEKGDFTIEIVAPKLHIDKVDAIDEGLNLCGCAGNAPPGKTASLVNLYGNLYETQILGAAATYDHKGKGDTIIRVGAGSTLQSDIHKSGEATGYVEVKQKVTKKTKALGNASFQEDQVVASVGTHTWVKEDTVMLKTNYTRAQGKQENSDTLSGSVNLYPTAKIGIGINGGVKRNRDNDDTRFVGGLDVNYKTSEHTFVRVFGATDVPTDPKAKTGGIIGLSFGGRF